MNIDQLINGDPHAGKLMPCVIIYIFDSAGRTLLFKRRKPPFLGCWEPAGGKIEFGEKLLDAARREATEESGILISDVEFVGAFDHIFGLTYHRIRLCFAAKVNDNPEVNVSEHKEYKWFYVSNLPDDLIPEHADILKKAFEITKG